MTGEKEKKSFIKEFKEFATQGNMLDMAVGIVLGGAFGAVINSIVNDILMPFVGYITAGTDFTDLAWQINETTSIGYGAFIQTFINFIIIALAIFLMIKFINKLKNSKPEEEEVVEISEDIQLLSEIRDLLKNQNK